MDLMVTESLKMRPVMKPLLVRIVALVGAMVVVAGCAGGQNVREVSCRMLASLTQTLKGFEPSLELAGRTDACVYRPDVLPCPTRGFRDGTETRATRSS